MVSRSGERYIFQDAPLKAESQNLEKLLRSWLFCWGSQRGWELREDPIHQRGMRRSEPPGDAPTASVGLRGLHIKKSKI